MFMIFASDEAALPRRARCEVPRLKSPYVREESRKGIVEEAPRKPRAKLLDSSIETLRASNRRHRSPRRDSEFLPDPAPRVARA